MSLNKLRSRVDLSASKFIATLKRARSPTSPTSPSAGRTNNNTNNKNAQTMPLHRDSDLPPIPDPTPPPPPLPKDDEWGDVRYALQATLPTSDSPKPHVLVLARKPAPTYPSKLPSLPPTADGAFEVSPPSSPSPPPQPAKLARASTTSRIPAPAARTGAAMRRAANVTLATPEEAEMKRRDAQRRREAEERLAAREEAARQARLKAEKEAILQKHREEEEARKAALEEELRHAAAEREKRAAMEREREVLEGMLAEEKRRQEREKRRALTERMMRERTEIQRRGSAEGQRREEARKRVREARLGLAARLKAESTRRGVWLTGWVTVQAEDCLSWKRRWFELGEERLRLYKDAEETEQPVDQVQLAHILRIREVEDGCEELEAVPNSFALELRGGGQPLTMFTQTSEEKEKVVALLTSRLA